MTRLVRSLAATLIVVAIAPCCHAAWVQMEFDSLPSAQGWVFVPFGANSGATESEIFSVSGGALTQNSIGQALGGPAATVYTRTLPLDPNGPYTVTWRSRVLADQGNTGSSLYGYGFQVAVRNGAASVQIAMTTDRLRDHLLQTVFRDNTGFHDFRLEVAPSSGYQLWIDNVLTMSGALATLGNNQLDVGDGTGITNALAELTEYTFYQPGMPPGVPGNMTVGKLTPDGSTLSVAWDVTTCAAPEDHLIVFGTGSQLPDALGGSYALSGGECDRGSTSPFTWTIVPDAANDPADFLTSRSRAHGARTAPVAKGRGRSPQVDPGNAA